MKINFKERTINGKPYLSEHKNINIQECLEEIERLYKIYKYSTPSNKDERRTYFYALPADKLTDAQLVCGVNRYEARKELELYVLEMICNGSLKWDKDAMKGNWFYQGNDPDLIILREWIEK